MGNSKGKRVVTDFLISSKKVCALSGMLAACCVCGPAQSMPDVAFVELPPMNLRVIASA